jgi:hypothetical protein
MTSEIQDIPEAYIHLIHIKQYYTLQYIYCKYIDKKKLSKKKIKKNIGYMWTQKWVAENYANLVCRFSNNNFHIFFFKGDIL